MAIFNSYFDITRGYISKEQHDLSTASQRQRMIRKSTISSGWPIHRSRWKVGCSKALAWKIPYELIYIYCKLYSSINWLEFLTRPYSFYDWVIIMLLSSSIVYTQLYTVIHIYEILQSYRCRPQKSNSSWFILCLAPRISKLGGDPRRHGQENQVAQEAQVGHEWGEDV